MTTRTITIATRTMASIPAKALPLAGIVVLVGGTAWEIKMHCDQLEDLNVLYGDLDIDQKLTTGAADTVCNIEVPTVAELRSLVFSDDVDGEL